MICRFLNGSATCVASLVAARRASRRRSLAAHGERFGIGHSELGERYGTLLAALVERCGSRLTALGARLALGARCLCGPADGDRTSASGTWHRDGVHLCGPTLQWSSYSAAGQSGGAPLQHRCGWIPAAAGERRQVFTNAGSAAWRVVPLQSNMGTRRHTAAIACVHETQSHAYMAAVFLTCTTKRRMRMVSIVSIQSTQPSPTQSLYHCQMVAF